MRQNKTNRIRMKLRPHTCTRTNKPMPHIEPLSYCAFRTSKDIVGAGAFSCSIVCQKQARRKQHPLHTAQGYVNSVSNGCRLWIQRLACKLWKRVYGIRRNIMENETEEHVRTYIFLFDIVWYNLGIIASWEMSRYPGPMARQGDTTFLPMKHETHFCEVFVYQPHLKTCHKHIQDLCDVVPGFAMFSLRLFQWKIRRYILTAMPPVGQHRKTNMVNCKRWHALPTDASGPLGSYFVKTNSAQHLRSFWFSVPSFWLRWFELQQFWFDRSLCREGVLGRNQRNKICRVPTRVLWLPSNSKPMGRGRKLVGQGDIWMERICGATFLSVSFWCEISYRVRCCGPANSNVSWYSSSHVPQSFHKPPPDILSYQRQHYAPTSSNYPTCPIQSAPTEFASVEPLCSHLIEPLSHGFSFLVPVRHIF